MKKTTEPLATEPLAICKKCNAKKRLFITLGECYRNEKPMYNHVMGKMMVEAASVEYCHFKNSHGQCPDFQPRFSLWRWIKATAKLLCGIK